MRMFMLAKIENSLIILLIFIILIYFIHCSDTSPLFCNVSLSHSCSAWLYYVPQTPQTLEETTSLFHSNLVNRTKDGYLIGVNCSCPVDHDDSFYHSHADYTVRTGDTWDQISSRFGSLVVKKPDKSLVPSLNIELDVLCGCYENMEVLTYEIVSGDTLYMICSRFNTELNKTARLNKLVNPAFINPGDVIFIPEPAGFKNLILVDTIGDDNINRGPRKASKFQIPMIVGTIVAVVLFVLLLIIIFLWRFYYNKQKETRPTKSYMRSMSYLPCNLMSPSSNTKSGESIAASFSFEKATDFPYEEVRDATSNFSLSLKIGQGSHGSVFLGKLRGNDVAIKQMQNTKSREFFSELNILCKVHHTNLIELIGYAAGGDSLFLVYEFAENGALSDHLHNPAVRGHKPLSWKTRVQIALDAAKGLEYIHMHTKPYYVHRDVKTSNILLDSKFRAKIADFGLVKLLEQSPDSDVRTAASRIVGTFGYLAPEYVRDGCVTSKSDVYAFGVVLMELLTGQPALSRDSSLINPQYIEHRSLVDYILSVLENDDPLTKLTQSIDPNLSDYHKDSLLQLALLSKDCVDDDWNRRPNMCKVVTRLSHILVCSEEFGKNISKGSSTLENC